MKKPELLSPAGNMECLKAAIEAGCDAVYIGGKHFGARNYADNFSEEEMIEAINYAHLYGVKIYVTLNIMITEELIKPFIKYVEFLYKNNVDALIMEDIGMIDYVRQVYPKLEIHASTQMHIHNLEGVKFIEKLGLKRVVLARETNIELLKEIKEKTNIELEVFIHGALCVSYSGECLMSSLIGGRSGNKGTCSQCCRMKYDLVHEGKTINNDNYLLSMKDLNTLEHIGNLIDIGIDSLKIEGRMKSKEYVYLVTKMYRKTIDTYIETRKIKIEEKEIENLKKIFNREYTKGFLNNEENNNIVNMKRPNHIGIPLGKVVSIKNNYVKIKLDNELNLKDGIRILNKIEDIGTTIYKMKVNNEFKESAKKGDIIEIRFENKIKVEENDLVLKTTDYKLINEIDSKINSKSRKVLINGSISCKIGEPIILKINDSKNYIEIKSKSIVEKSIKTPTTKERIEEQIKKLGNTVYMFDNLSLDIDDNIFVNIKDLNEIRRQAILKLNEKRLYKIPYIKNEYNNEVKEYNEKKGYTAYINNMDQYNKAKNVEEIITDDIDLFNEIMLDNKVTLRLPRVIYDYPNYNIRVLVGEYGSLNKYEDIISDFSFNVANSYSVAFLHNNNVKRVTLSLELKKEEIKKIVENYKQRYKKNPNLEVVVSMYPEVMVSKFNLIKYFNIPNNDNYLRDKFKNKFKIKIKNNLMYIYHYKKLEIENYKELFDIGINRLRIEYSE